MDASSGLTRAVTDTIYNEDISVEALWKRFEHRFPTRSMFDSLLLVLHEVELIEKRDGVLRWVGPNK